MCLRDSLTTLLYRKFFSNPKGGESKKQQSTLAFSKPKAQKDRNRDPVDVEEDGDGQENRQPVIEGNEDSRGDIEMMEAETIRSSGIGNGEEKREKVGVKEEEMFSPANGEPTQQTSARLFHGSNCFTLRPDI